LRVIHIKFLPSLWLERGPVAETEVGTVGNGLGGTSLLIRRRECLTPWSWGVEESLGFSFFFPLLFMSFCPTSSSRGGGELDVVACTSGDFEPEPSVNFRRFRESSCSSSFRFICGQDTGPTNDSSNDSPAEKKKTSANKEDCQQIERSSFVSFVNLAVNCWYF
jgi:hypothetical protein